MTAHKCLGLPVLEEEDPDGEISANEGTNLWRKLARSHGIIIDEALTIVVVIIVGIHKLRHICVLIFKVRLIDVLDC